jgi:hypothetical protein
VWLISSYEHGTRAALKKGRMLEIRSKSPETLKQLRDLIVGGSRGSGELLDDVTHVLITGAGFEFKSEPHKQQLGIPATSQLLRGWLERVYPGEVEKTKGFPIPQRFASRRDFRSAAMRGDLDAYWSHILREERAAAGGDVSEIVEREAKLRRIFRDEFLRYDWGFLPQATAAASLDWSAWISTNYTRFANRAIDIVGKDWCTIEFGEEAENLSRKLLHGLKKQPGERFLFKVHGDISHILTMAISAEDKTVETKLSGFMPLYLAAQAYLHELAKTSRSVVWHIVGHGLKDELLVHVISDVYSAAPEKHHFHVVALTNAKDLKRREHPAFLLRKKLESPQGTVQGYLAKAGEYLTRLARVGLAEHETVLRELKEILLPEADLSP